MQLLQTQLLVYSLHCSLKSLTGCHAISLIAQREQKNTINDPKQRIGPSYSSRRKERNALQHDSIHLSVGLSNFRRSEAYKTMVDFNSKGLIYSCEGILQFLLVSDITGIIGIQKSINTFIVSISILVSILSFTTGFDLTFKKLIREFF